MTIKVTVSGQDAQAAAQIQAMLNAILSAGQDDTQAEIELDNQAGNAPENDVEPLTNAPVGYVLVERHPTMNIALYEHRTEAHALTLIDGVVATLPNMSPEELFDLVVEAKNADELNAKLEAMQEESDDDGELRYVAGYQRNEYGHYDLLAVYNLEQAKETFGEKFEAWLEVTGSFHDAILFASELDEVEEFTTNERINAFREEMAG